MIFSPITIKSVISSFVEYLSKSVTNYWLNCVAMSLREQTISYNINQILFHLTEIRNQPKIMKIFGFLETYFVNCSTKYHWFLYESFTLEVNGDRFPRSANSLHSSQNSSIFGPFLNGSSFTYLVIVKKLFARGGWYLHT